MVVVDPELSRRAASFDAVADVYAAVRPGYPQQLSDWLVPADARQVVDVGAGTGKFTATLVRPGRTVVAVDPSPQMLAQLRRSLPGVDARIGTAEAIGVPDGWADAVTVAQAWHWVDVPAACAEVARALRPGGQLGLIWNYRDERVGWVRELGIAMHADGDHYTGSIEAATPEVVAPFGRPEIREHSWRQPHTRESLLDLVRSRSYFAVLDPWERETALADVISLLDTHPELAGRQSFELPYVTIAFRYTLGATSVHG